MTTDPAICPLCGNHNTCEMADTGVDEATECWCVAEIFPPDIMARIPDDQLGRACICRACLQKQRERAEG